MTNISQKLLVGNWKLNPCKLDQAVKLAGEIDLLLPDQNIITVVCPPALYLSALKGSARRYLLGAQDVSGYDQGSFTGEISALQLSDLGLKYVLIGHSERRQFLGETVEMIAKKIKLAHQEKLVPIVCLGFGIKAQASDSEVKAQIRKDFNKVFSEHDLEQLVIAYEPTWAIGTGRQPDDKHVQEITNFIKELNRHHEVASELKVLYGGSINADNIGRFTSATDGFLVGGASLEAEEFAKIASQLE